MGEVFGRRRLPGGYPPCTRKAQTKAWWAAARKKKFMAVADKQPCWADQDQSRSGHALGKLERTVHVSTSAMRHYVKFPGLTSNI